jgi:methionyl-tRNA formyltransferase
MGDKIKIALLCNNKMAMPALQRMAGEGVLCAVATADKDGEVVALYRQKAAEYNVPCLTTTFSSYKQQLNSWVTDVKPDAVFVMTYPWWLPESLLSLPEMGFLNFHYGLLPEMRGADPVFESIRQRLPVAGATVHMMDAGLDTGPIVLREQIPLPPEYTYGMLSSQVAWLGEKMCTQIINDLRLGKELKSVPQDETNAKYWPKIGEADITIQWRNMDSASIMALVRACNPVAKGAPAMLNGWKIGICDVSEVNLQGDASAITPGTILAIDPQNGLIVCCRNGKALKLEVVYTAEGMLPGYKLGFMGIGQGMVFS